MVNNVHYILPFLVCAFKCDIVFFWSWQECVSSTFARTTLTNGIIVSFQYIYFPLAFLFTGIHECNKHHHTTECQCFSSDMQDFANLWPLFILLQVHCDKNAHFNVRLSAMRRMWLFISSNFSSTWNSIRLLGLTSSFSVSINLMNDIELVVQLPLMIGEHKTTCSWSYTLYLQRTQLSRWI